MHINTIYIYYIRWNYIKIYYVYSPPCKSVAVIIIIIIIIFI